MLKENIESIEKQLLSHSTVNTTLNIQTSAFLGLGRGATMNATPRRLPRVPLGTSAEDDMLDAMNGLNVTTPFSNRIQQEFTNQMTLCASSDSDPVDNDT
jgi:hypothetical protein